MKSPWLIVATREIVVRALSRVFLIGLLVMVSMVAGMIALTVFLDNRTDTFDIAVLADDGAARAAVEGAERTASDTDENVEFTIVEVASVDAAETALAAETVDAWLRSGTGGWTIAGWRDPDNGLVQLLTTAVNDQVVASNAAAVGTTLDELTAGSELETERLNDDAVDGTVVDVTRFVLSLLFLMGAIGSGTMIAGSVIEEKQSRLVEIIATAVPLRQLLFGKILGNAAIALGQNLVMASVALIAVSFTDFSTILPQLSATAIWFVLFFIVGFVAVAGLFAVAGSLASRAEDLQSTTVPVTMGLVAAYFVSFAAEGTFGRAISYIPPASIITMPARVLNADAAWWEPPASLAVLAVVTVLAVLVSERAYRGSLMQTSGRVSWRTALARSE